MRHRSALTALLSSVSFIASSCAAPPPPQVVVRPSASASASGSAGAIGAPSDDDLGPLVRLGFLEDHIAGVDGEVAPDGHKDFGLRVRISGEVLGLTLFSSDTKGNKIGIACYDTYAGATPMPKVLGIDAPTGGSTTALAVVDSHGVLLNPKATLPPHTFHDEVITLWVSDPNDDYFREGRAFTLLVLRPGNRVDRSTVVLV